MKKKIKDTLKAMAVDPPHICPSHQHGMGCDDCKTFGRYFRDTYPPPVFQTEKIVYRWSPAPLALCIVLTILCLGILFAWSKSKQPVFPEPERIEYPVYIHDAEPWKTKCQKAWTILNKDHDAGRAAFRVLNQ